MSYDFNKVKKICDENIANRIFKNSTDLNLPSDFFNLMISTISLIFKAYPPEIINTPFSVYVNNNFYLHKISKIYYQTDLKKINYKNANIIILDKNRFVIHYGNMNKYIKNNDIFSYSFEGKQNEYFKLNSKTIKIDEYIDPSMYSTFSCPTYAKMDEALEEYYNKNARNSNCYIIKEVWTDATKQQLKEKPEDYFQKSLSQFLNIYLRGYTVKREQTVDDSHPVDIKATGPDLNTVSLVEIKWIGNSKKVRYSDTRANEGAKQLEGYLNSSKSSEPDKNFKGYLTVFDARRKKNKKNYFDDVEIKYNQEYLSNKELTLKRFFMCE